MGKHILEIRHYSKIYSGNKKADDDLQAKPRPSVQLLV